MVAKRTNDQIDSGERSFEAQLHLWSDVERDRVWSSVSTSTGKPYRYKTKRAAASMLEHYYPQVLHEHKRVVAVDFPPNMETE